MSDTISTIGDVAVHDTSPIRPITMVAATLLVHAAAALTGNTLTRRDGLTAAALACGSGAFSLPGAALAATTAERASCSDQWRVYQEMTKALAANKAALLGYWGIAFACGSPAVFAPPRHRTGRSPSPATTHERPA